MRPITGAVFIICVICGLLITQTTNARQNRPQDVLPTAVATFSLQDAKPIVVGQPITDTLDEATSARQYRFDAKAGESYRVSLEVLTCNFWTVLSITSADFSQMLGSSDGEALIDSSLHVAIEKDGAYVVTVEYATPSFGTASPGTYAVN